MSSHPLLKVEISQLSVSERIQLAEELWDSIQDPSDELPLTEAQQQELDSLSETLCERRLTQYEQDPTAGSDWESVKQRLGLTP
jgi:putative addiction module component (TIGR02574 family)